MSGFEENEISKNAFGGTELAKRKLAGMLDPKLLDDFQIICSRPRDLQQDKIRVFWCHDLPEDPESTNFRDKTWRDQFHKFVFISNWQYQRYQLLHGLDVDMKSIVFESGIEPAPADVFEMKEKKPIRLVYTSTPQRGLELLVPVFEKLCEVHDDIHLDVFSSFKIYGWEEADKQFEPLYERIRNNPKATYHGFVPNDELRAHLNKSHIFAYPSIWYETSCRAMLEAMSAGLICVHPNLAALPETSGGLNMMYHVDLTDKIRHANVFASHLDVAIRMVRDGQNVPMSVFAKEFVDRRYNIGLVKLQWENLLMLLKDQYPTVESRAAPKERFLYKT